MYNHYIPKDTIYQRIPEAETWRDAFHGHQERTKKNIFQSFFPNQEEGKKNAGLSGILKRFKLDDIDTGDILLFLILIFVLLEDENWELALILGLVLFLSFRDEDDPV